MNSTITLPQDHVKTWEENGVKFTAEISPCSWMYPGDGLQIGIKIADRGDRIFRRVGKRFQECAIADFDALLTGIVLEKCNKPTCTNLTFKEHKGGFYNKEGYCEKCRIERINEEFAEESAKEDAKEARLDAKRKREGYTHKVIAWIHPDAGDDYQIMVHSKSEMTDAQIKAMIRRRGSRITTDYTQTAL